MPPGLFGGEGLLAQGLYGIGDIAQRTYQGILRNPTVDAYRMGIGQRMEQMLTNPSEFYKSAIYDAVPTPTEMATGFSNPESMPPQLRDKFLNFGLAGLTAFHGSPHKFDKFDASKIGTGEGAQAYGHGVYFAENADVAKNYAPRDLNYENKLMRLYKAAERKQDYSSMEVLESAMLHSTPAELRSQYPSATPLIDQIAQHQSKANFSLYKVDIPDEMIPKMLDWDKPLSQQSESVQKALRAALPKLPDVATGQQVVDALKNRAMSALDPSARKGLESYAQDASFELSRLGIPGIRYLDQGSRSAGKGTSNYVVFPGMEQQVKILSRE